MIFRLENPNGQIGKTTIIYEKVTFTESTYNFPFSFFTATEPCRRAWLAYLPNFSVDEEDSIELIELSKERVKVKKSEKQTGILCV